MLGGYPTVRLPSGLATLWFGYPPIYPSLTWAGRNLENGFWDSGGLPSGLATLWLGATLWFGHTLFPLTPAPEVQALHRYTSGCSAFSYISETRLQLLISCRGLVAGF